jgi:hypothetical protein
MSNNHENRASRIQYRATCPATCLAIALLSSFGEKGSDGGNFFMQNKANFKNAQINVTDLITRVYVNFRPFCPRKNKANQTLFLHKYWLCFSPKLALKLMPKEGLIWIVDQLRNLCNNAGFSLIWYYLCWD